MEIEKKINLMTEFIKSIPELKELHPFIAYSHFRADIVGVFIDYITDVYFNLNEFGSKELLFERIITALEDAIKLNTCQVEKIKRAYKRWKDESA